VLHRLQFGFELLRGLVNLFFELPLHDSLHVQSLLLLLLHLLLKFEHFFLELVLTLKQQALISLVVRPNQVEGNARIGFSLDSLQFDLSFQFNILDLGVVQLLVNDLVSVLQLIVLALDDHLLFLLVCLVFYQLALTLVKLGL